MSFTNAELEDEVRRIARHLWPEAEYNGASIENGRERNGVFKTSDFIHVIECTTSRRKDKAEEDHRKLERLVKRLEAQHPDKFVKGWFVTADEPTADQRSVFRAGRRIVAVSYDQFRSMLVDTKSYLAARENYPFGSVKDPGTGATQFKLDYVSLDIIGNDDTLHSVDQICEHILEGRRFVLIGDYGAGKSATAREVFFGLRRRFLENQTHRFPMMLNLRDHHGQENPIEALERHARLVGFKSPDQLVKAWRAGFGIMLLDGFDEFATAGWAGKTKTLRDLRYRSMKLVREFLRQTPKSIGVLLAGRAHYFDSVPELRQSMGLSDDFKLLNINEFNDKQIKTFLTKSGLSDTIPEWIPSRPLLLGYLVSKGLLRPAIETNAGSNKAEGWNKLLDQICIREAEIEAGIDPGTVQKLVGRLATIARSSIDGLGPITGDQITNAFQNVCGYPPDDRGMVLLQRIPGLGTHSVQDGSRVFIDRSFAEAARGYAIVEFIANPYDNALECDLWQSSLTSFGADVAAHRCQQNRLGPGKIIAAMSSTSTLPRSNALRADIFLIMLSSNCNYGESRVYIKDVLIPEVLAADLDGNLASVEFQDSIIERIEVPLGGPFENLPTFLRCHFGMVDGSVGQRDMPPTKFIECTYDEFENPARTTKAILELGLPLGSKVLLTILKKLYNQPGCGRRESAFFRGLDPRGKELVPKVLGLLRKHGFAIQVRHEDQWLPTRISDCRRRALTMLAAPNTSTDLVLIESREIC